MDPVSGRPTQFAFFASPSQELGAFDSLQAAESPAASRPPKRTRADGGPNGSGAGRKMRVVFEGYNWVSFFPGGVARTRIVESLTWFCPTFKSSVEESEQIMANVEVAYEFLWDGSEKSSQLAQKLFWKHQMLQGRFSCFDCILHAELKWVKQTFCIQD